MALTAEAGDDPQAYWFEFPAATTTMTPAAAALFVAVLRDVETPSVPILMLMTAPFGRGCLTTQSIAATIPATDPEPDEFKTLTAIKLTFLAIPYLLLPTVPKIEME
jgi:hypothetical protein